MSCHGSPVGSHCRGWDIVRIRNFYTRKVKFTQQSYHDKLSTILTEVCPFSSQIHLICGGGLVCDEGREPVLRGGKDCMARLGTCSLHHHSQNAAAQFPKLDDVHPFYADLMNVLYDRDHYKLALSQLNTARHLIDRFVDYVCCGLSSDLRLPPLPTLRTVREGEGEGATCLPRPARSD
jgi:nucleolar GTP-binding protein